MFHFRHTVYTTRLFLFYRKKCSVNALDNSISRGYLPGVQYILKEDIPINRVQQPFMWACKDGNVSIMKECVSFGVNPAHSHNLPLRYATCWGYSTEGIQALLRMGCVIDACTQHAQKITERWTFLQTLQKTPR